MFAQWSSKVNVRITDFYRTYLSCVGKSALDSIVPVRNCGGRMVKEATGCDGINVVQNNYPSSGQVVFHVHGRNHLLLLLYSWSHSVAVRILNSPRDSAYGGR